MNAPGIGAVCSVRRRLAPNVLCMLGQDRPALRQSPRRGRYPKSVVSLHTCRVRRQQVFTQQARCAELCARFAELTAAIRRHSGEAEEHRKVACRPVILLADRAGSAALRDAQMHEGLAEDFSEQLRALGTILVASPGLCSGADLPAVRRDGGAV